MAFVAGEEVGARGEGVGMAFGEFFVEELEVVIEGKGVEELADFAVTGGAEEAIAVEVNGGFRVLGSGFRGREITLTAALSRGTGRGSKFLEAVLAVEFSLAGAAEVVLVGNVAAVLGPAVPDVILRGLVFARGTGPLGR